MTELDRYPTASPPHDLATPPPRHLTTSPIRRLLQTIGPFSIPLLLFRGRGAEPYGVPTGSMAPALMGNHKVVTCPRCGYDVRVGYHDEAGGGRGSNPHAECPNCGFDDLPLDQAPVCRGDHLLVN